MNPGVVVLDADLSASTRTADFAKRHPERFIQMGIAEQGTETRQAMPWMRPAFESKKAEAVAVFERELPAAIDRIVKKLAKQNGVA